MTTQLAIDSRACTMLVPLNEQDECAACTRMISFAPPGKEFWVLANVYEDCLPCPSCSFKGRRWDRLEHWHVKCYEDKGNPYGDAPFRRPKISKRTSW